MALKLRYKKKGDGSAAFTAVRGDGSSTTAQIGEAGGFGPVHDLAHYVVENQVCIKKGFLGLLASGWSVEDFNWTVQSQSAEIPCLSPEELAALRQRLAALRDQWDALTPGETLELRIGL